MAGSVGRWAAVPVSTQLDPRVLPLSAEAELFYTRAWLYAGEHCTDGVIPPAAHSLLAMKLTMTPAALIDELSEVGLLKNRRADTIITDYLEVNPTAAQVRKKSDHGRKAAIARWAGQKATPDPDPQPGEYEPDPDANNPSGNASGNANGNTPHGTGRDGTDSTDIGGEVGGALAVDVDKEIVDSRVPLQGDPMSSSPSENREDERPITPAHRREFIAAAAKLDHHFDGTFPTEKVVYPVPQIHYPLGRS